MPVTKVSTHRPSGGFSTHLAAHVEIGGLQPQAQDPLHSLLWLLVEGNSPEWTGRCSTLEFDWKRPLPKGPMLRLGSK